MNLTHYLKDEHIDAGLHLVSDGPVLLLKDATGRNLAYFHTYTALLKDVHYEADQAVNWQKSGIEFVKAG